MKTIEKFDGIENIFLVNIDDWTFRLIFRYMSV